MKQGQSLHLCPFQIVFPTSAGEFDSIVITVASLTSSTLEIKTVVTKSYSVVDSNLADPNHEFFEYQMDVYDSLTVAYPYNVYILIKTIDTKINPGL